MLTMNINKNFYDKYENGLTWKVHLMRWLFGIIFLSPIVILAVGGKNVALVYLGVMGLLIFPYVVGGMFYDMRMMRKHKVNYK